MSAGHLRRFRVCPFDISMQVLETVAKHRPNIKFNFQPHLLGGVSHFTFCTLYHVKLTPIQASIDATGSPLTDEALTAAKNADAVILGAIGGPVRATPVKSHFQIF